MNCRKFVNVLKDEMTVVGPRPEVRRYVEMFSRDYDEYRNQSAVLALADDSEPEYVTRVLWDKIALGKSTFGGPHSLWICLSSSGLRSIFFVKFT